MSPSNPWSDLVQASLQSLPADPVRLDTADHSFLTPLSDQAILRVGGTDAIKFMQGQFTCDLMELTPGRSSLGACCTPKGRMLALFRITPVGEEFWLRMPLSIAEKLAAHLKKYMVFYKASLQLDKELVVLGLQLDKTPATSWNLEEWPQQTDAAITLNQQTRIQVSDKPHAYEIWTTQAEAVTLANQLTAQFKLQADEHWRLHEIRAGRGEVVESTQEEFVPQMLNLQSLGGISFKKGCYTGQEIVARMQYLGSLKKRMYRFSCPIGELPPAGAALLDSDGRSQGQLVRGVLTQDAGLQGLAVINQEMLEEQAPLHIESTSTPIEIHELPYAVETIRNQRPRV